MRGGKSLSERGVIPRLLSGIYRRSRKLEKDSQGATSVEVSMSYYEIYNVRSPIAERGLRACWELVLICVGSGIRPIRSP
jgi:hypothetical protein